MKEKSLIGILGVEGAYGKWLRAFFERIGFEVIGSDLNTELSNEDVAQQADVLIFSVPIRYTVEVIESVLPFLREGQLLLDITSVKQGPVNAMLKSKAEVVGLHPMCAPTVETWKGQTVMLCPARLEKWRTFVFDVLEASEATVKMTTPEEHDHQMAVVQDLPHASILVMAALLRHMGTDVKESLSCTSPFYGLRGV